MRSKKLITLLSVLGGLVLFGVVVGCLGLLDRLDRDFFHATHSPLPCTSAAEAKARGTWVTDVCVTPPTLQVKGEVLEFKEAWVEEAAFQEWGGLKVRRLGRYYLCFLLAQPVRLFSDPGNRPNFMPA